MLFYISTSFKNLLNQHQLNTFNNIWQLRADWFEPPNHKRDGWSGVCKLELSRESVFLKRQHNHTRRTWLKPRQGESTLKREFDILQHLQKHQINAPEWIAFGETLNAGKLDALLMMKALTGYHSLEDYVKNQIVTQPLIFAIAAAISRMHQAGIQHRSLYPKHIFVSHLHGNFEIAFIDFEKSRFTWMPKLRAVTDLRTFFRKVSLWPVNDQLTFFKAYYALELTGKPLNFVYRTLWFMMRKR